MTGYRVFIKLVSLLGHTSKICRVLRTLSNPVIEGLLAYSMFFDQFGNILIFDVREKFASSIEEVFDFFACFTLT